MLRFLLTIGIGLPVLGGLFIWYGFKERDIARASSATPESISLSKLIARGPEGNANIILTDYVAIHPHVVQRGRRGSYSGTWVPVVPKDAPAAEAGGAVPKVFVFSDKVRNPDGAYQQLSNPQLPGMVSNTIMTPNSGAMSDLEEQFPRTDFSTCIFIHEGREPASEEKFALMIIGGIVAILIGISSLVLALLLWKKRKAEAARQKWDRKSRRSSDEDDEYRPRKRRYVSDDDEDRPSRKRRSDVDDDSPRRRRVADEEDDGDRPSRKRRTEEEDDRPSRRRSRDEDDRHRRRPRRDDD